jgi:hypothetical protein
MSTSSPVTERTTSGPVTKIRPSGPRITTSVRRDRTQHRRPPAQHHRDLRDPAGRQGHGPEDQPDRVQRQNALGQSRPAECHSPRLGAESATRPFVGSHDHLAAVVPHRTAHDRRVGAEGTVWVPVDCAVAASMPDRSSGVISAASPRRTARQPLDRAPWVVLAGRRR